VELQLSGGSAVVKLAENTTFILERMSDGQTSLQLVYGRIRAKVEKLAGTETFSVRSVQAIAGVRGTDFGVDVVASRSVSVATTTTSAYCFEGSVEVTAFVQSDVLAAESLEPIPRAFVIESGEMVTVEGETGKSEAVKTTLDESIQSFWQSNDYVIEAEAPITAPSVAATQAAAPQADEKAIFEQGYERGYAEAKAAFEPDPDYVPEGFLSVEEAEAIRTAARLQKGGILAGAMIGAGGAALAVRGFILMQGGDAEGGAADLRSAAIVSAMAVPFLVLSLFSRP
jgi:hypothetical protein